MRFHLAVAAVVALLALPVFAEHPPGDGATSHRKFDDVARWKKVFDDPERDRWQKPGELIAALSLQPGMDVADIGAGTGYLARRLSSAVGTDGSVFMLEVEPNLIAHLRDRAEKEKTANVVPVLASKDNPRLPAQSIDMALFVDSYHHVDSRRSYLAILRRALRPGARVGIVEWKPGKQPVGPDEEDHKISREQVTAEMTGAGFEPLDAPDLLPHQYLLIFRMTSPAQ